MSRTHSSLPTVRGGVSGAYVARGVDASIAHRMDTRLWWRSAHTSCDVTMGDVLHDVHPVIRAMIRNLPAGVLLDDVVRSFNVAAGDVRGPLGEAVVRDLLQRGSLTDVRLVAATCTDNADIWRYIHHDDCSVAAAVCYNQHLQQAHVGGLFERSITRRESSLAVALAKQRRDLATWAREPYLSVLATDHANAAEAVAENICHMTIEEFEALERCMSVSQGAYVLDDACDATLRHVAQGAAVDLRILMRIYERYPLHAGQALPRSFRATRGLITQLHAMPVNDARRLERYIIDPARSVLNLTGATMMRSQHHICSEWMLSRISELLGVAGGDAAESFAMFASWRVDAQVAFLNQWPNLAAELLHHLPEIGVELARSSNCDQLRGEVVRLFLSNNDLLRGLRDAVVARRIKRRDVIDDVVLGAFHVSLNTPKTVWRFIEYFFADGGTTDVGRALLDMVSSNELEAMLDQFENHEAGRRVHTALYEDLVTDQFIGSDLLVNVMDVHVGSSGMATWSHIAIDRVAAALLECRLDIAAMHQIESLLRSWRLTPRQLVRVVRSL